MPTTQDERPDDGPIETVNDFMVAVGGDDTLAMVLPPLRPFTKDEALRLAAWLVVLADPLDERWPAVKDAVRNT
jgi:hypothetical protein